MDLRRFELWPAESRAAVTIYQGPGEKDHRLDGAAADPAIEAARSLLSDLAANARRAPDRLVVDSVARIASAHFPDGEPLILDGAAYDAIAPRLTDVARALLNAALPRAPLSDGESDAPGFWEGLYQAGRDGWELGRAAPPIARWVASHAVAGKRALSPGCGRGHEARLLARAGAQVIAVDLAREPLVAARALAEREGVRVDFRERDLFRLTGDPERFDLAVEHCCFCAIAPSLRDDYVATMADLLLPGGDLLGLFWAHGRPGGPPYSVTRAELAARFETRFTVEEEEIPRDSVAARAGQEILIRFSRRA